jgi:hypothetical protein
MKKLLWIALAASGLAFVPAQRSDAQISIGYGYHPNGYGYYPYGYYQPYPYYGYYRPYSYYRYYYGPEYYWYNGHRAYYNRHHRHHH